MKKLALILSLLLLLTACGSTVAPVVTTEATSTEAAVNETEALTEAPTEASATEGVVESLYCTTDFEIAKTFIDKNLDELKAAIGEPVDAYYEESCIGEGEDGILAYDYFTVYTFRPADGSAETVVDAEMND